MSSSTYTVVKMLSVLAQEMIQEFLRVTGESRQVY